MADQASLDQPARYRAQSSIKPTNFYGSGQSPFHTSVCVKSAQVVTKQITPTKVMPSCPRSNSESSELPTMDHIFKNLQATVSSPLVDKCKKKKKASRVAQNSTSKMPTPSKAVGDFQTITSSNSSPSTTSSGVPQMSKTQAIRGATQAGPAKPVTKIDIQTSTPPNSSPSNTSRTKQKTPTDVNPTHDSNIDDSTPRFDIDDEPTIPQPANLSDLSFDERRKRNQSEPPRSAHRIKSTNDTSMAPPVVTSDPISGVGLLALARSVKRIEKTLNQIRGGQQIIQQPAPAPASVPPPAQPTNNASNNAHRTRKKEKSRAERKATDRPEYPRDVPIELRESDDALIEIGKIVTGYQRHVAAPYAFAWSGRLYTEYDSLLDREGDDGKCVFTTSEKRRLTK